MRLTRLIKLRLIKSNFIVFRGIQFTRVKFVKKVRCHIQKVGLCYKAPSRLINNLDV